MEFAFDQNRSHADSWTVHCWGAMVVDSDGLSLHADKADRMQTP